MNQKNLPKKAFLFSTDALIALIIIFLTILVAYPVVKYSQHKTEIQSDVLKILSSLKIGEVDNLYAQTLISQGEITDLNKTILEQLGTFYVTDTAKAQELAQSILSSFNTKENIGIWYGNQLLASLNATPFEEAKDIEVERQVISGIRSGEEITGFSARAFLSSDFQSKYFYFGGYVGDGNITSRIEYHGDITSAEMELAINNNFDVYINGHYSGNYEKSTSDFSPRKYILPTENFNSGTNLVEIKGDNLYIAGGYIKITYSSSAQFSQPEKYYFPGIEGLINIYDGFYIPADLGSMNIFLHYDSNYEIFLSIGNIMAYEKTPSGEVSDILTNSQLSSMLNYAELSRKTVPLRLGLKELQSGGGAGNADVVLITDLSGSMDSKMNSDYVGIARECDDPLIYDSSTKRISVAKCIDKQVVDTILNVSGNRIALSGFYADERSPYKGRVYEESLNTDADYLKSRIDAYSPQGGTCICCSINDAYKILNEQSNSNRTKSVIVMSDGIPTHTCQAASGCTGTRTGLPSEEGLWLGYGAGCYGGLDDCSVNDCQCASTNANWSSCRVYNELNAKVYSIGFGPLVTCQMASNTLSNIAQCGQGRYYVSDNATILQEFYSNISKEIIELSYTGQISVVSGNFNRTLLYPDSYIEFEYNKSEIPYGLMINLEKQFSDAYSGSFNVPLDTKITEAKAISYSGPRWTDSVEINNISVYDLKSYGQIYTELGDPYAISIDTGLIQENNTVKITTGLSPQNSSEGSVNNKIIYTLIKNASSYSPILAKAEGCIWNIEFEDSSIISLNVPSEYSGTENCYYQETRVEYNENDAIQTAVYNLLKSLDIDSNNNPDSKFTEQNLKISSSQITGIPYTWHTEVQIRRWA